MDYLPIFMRLAGDPCLVVGGGTVGARKAQLLLRAGARVTVVAERAGARLRAMRHAGRVQVLERRFRPEDLDGQRLVIAATDEPLVNRYVSAQARARGLPVNVADAPALCSFILPAIVDRSPVMIAVSSGGSAPVLASRLRARIETLLPASLGRLARLLGRYRQPVRRRFERATDRRRFWEEAVDGPVAAHMLAGRRPEAEAALRQALATGPAQGGEVWLVGAGPGDPDLLTLRALQLMQQADVVLYDRLVAPEIIERVRTEAERIYVGKETGAHALPQTEINRLLVSLAGEGKRVLRLKGGDPFVFGRGGEELEALAAAGVPFQVVPGITAAAGCAAYAGIPLTHRDHARTCSLMTGHTRQGVSEFDWRALARPGQTRVFYMGLQNLATLVESLTAHGLATDTPAALIEHGTTVRQRVVTGTIRDLPRLAAEHRLDAPTLVVIGEVVRLRDRLAWFRPRERDCEEAPRWSAAAN